ncbi:MAG: 2Fe-2S iron-sulfur cluster-binding protein, partial [Chloroflexota bacterium]
MNSKVRFLPDGVDVSVPAGTTLIEAAAAAKVALDAPCGHRGLCGKCRVKLLPPSQSRKGAMGKRAQGSGDQDSGLRTQDSLEPPTLPERTLLSREELDAGWRLACEARVTGDVVVEVPERSIKPAVVPISEIKPNPYIQKRHIHLPQATVEDVVADLTRIRRELGTDV